MRGNSNKAVNVWALVLLLITSTSYGEAIRLWMVQKLSYDPKSNENVISFIEDKEVLVVHDSSGRFTALTLTYLLLKPAELKLRGGSKWDEVRGQEVIGWDVVKPILIRTLKNISSLKGTKAYANARSKESKELKSLIVKLERYRKKTPSIGNITEVLSGYMEAQIADLSPIKVELFNGDKKQKEVMISDFKEAPSPVSTVVTFPFLLNKVTKAEIDLTVIAVDPSVLKMQ